MIKKIHTSNQICYTGPRIEELVRDYPEEMYSERLHTILNEFVDGFHFLRNYELAATIFGSARCTASQRVYKEARSLAAKLARDNFVIITGGGPGVMEAANRGAAEAGGVSVALNIHLPREQRTNPYVRESISFHYFFTRKVMLAFASEVYIFFPGGFGTLDEVFEIMTLVQTGKIEPVPIILVDKAYWEPLLAWIENTVYKEHKAVSKKDMKLYHVVANANEAHTLIRTMVKEGEGEVPRRDPVTSLRKSLKSTKK